MKKKMLYGALATVMCLGVVGCGNDSVENKDLTADDREEKHENKVVCNYLQSDGKYVLYFDENDVIEGFDAYASIDISETSSTEEDVKEMKKIVCNGEGEFKKEWIKECDMEQDGTKYTLHVYIDNGEWFGDMQNKDEILEYVNEYGIDGGDVTCK